MNIVYGVVGAGMGHATRSKVVIDYLRSRGHRVLVFTSGPAYELLRKDAPADVVRITGLINTYKDGRVQWLDSAVANALNGPDILASHVDAAIAMARFGPHLAISDYETLVGLHAKVRGIPLISIDNVQAVPRCEQDAAMVAHDPASYQLMTLGTALKLPPCDRYVITSFCRLPVKASCVGDTVLVPPIVREAVVEAKRTAPQGDHVLVYQTSGTDTRLIPTLRALAPQRFVVYGFKRDAREGNCTIKSFSDAGLIRDIAGAKAVITNGGMSLMGEAIFLGKPVYSVPLKSQFEQFMNAWYLERLGYGMRADEFEPAGVRRFLERVPALQARVQSAHRQEGNAVLYGEIERALRDFGPR